MPQILDRSGLDTPVIPDRVPSWLGKSSPNNLDEKWQVVLWNDEHNTMDHVIMALLKTIDEITDMETAVRLMITAHNLGTAVVAHCHKEKAEMYREKLESFGLTATLEKV